MLYLPYFMSWVIIGGIMMDILSPTDGIVKYFNPKHSGFKVNILFSKYISLCLCNFRRMEGFWFWSDYLYGGFN